MSEAEKITNQEVRNDLSKNCEGCGKSFDMDKFFKHVSHSKICKNFYGSRWDMMLSEKKKANQRNKYLKNRDDIIKKQDSYNRENWDAFKKGKRDRYFNKKSSIIAHNTNDSKKCEHCKKVFKTKLFVRHVSHSKECKTFYEETDSWSIMLNESKRKAKKKYREKCNQEELEAIDKEDAAKYDDTFVSNVGVSSGTYIRFCEGCKQSFQTDTFFKHVSHSISCKEKNMEIDGTH